MGLLLNLSLSLSLVFIGEYSTAFFLQLSYLLFLNKYLFYFLYLPLLHLILIKLFASSYYFLYFINLTLAILFLVNKKIILTKIKNALFLLNISLLYFFYQYYESHIYQLYLDIGFTDKINYINPEIGLILTLVHILSSISFLNFFTSCDSSIKKT